MSDTKATGYIPERLPALHPLRKLAWRIDDFLDHAESRYLSEYLDAAYDGAVADAAELARLTAEVERYRSAIRWALGYDEGEPEFHERRDGDKPYYWRTELARRAGAGVRDIKEAGNG